MGKIMSDETAQSLMNYIWREIELKFTCPETDFDLTTVSLALDWLKSFIEKSPSPRDEFGAQDAHKVLSVIQMRYLEKVGYRSRYDGKKERTDLPATAYRELTRGHPLDSLSVLQSLCKLFYSEWGLVCRFCGERPYDCLHTSRVNVIDFGKATTDAWRYHLRNLCEMTSPIEIASYFKRTIGIDLSGRGEHE